MAGGGTVLGAVAVIIAVFYQFALKDYLSFLGITRAAQSIQEFPYECRRIHHELLDGCEDLWLDHKDRKLYAACSDLDSRHGWSPALTAYNTSARKGTDHVTVLNIDEPGANGLFGLRALEISGGYKGALGDKEIDLHGIDVEKIGGGRLRFWMINHRPSVDYTTGLEIDATKHGANSTVEVFEHEIGSTQLEFVKTISDPSIYTPNDLALTGDGGFLLTNDHTSKTGVRREFGLLIGGGSIAYHSPTGKTQLITPQSEPSTNFPVSKFYGPNGFARGKDGLFYMADSASGTVSVYTLSAPQPNSGSDTPILHQIDSIDLKMPLDNISVDSEGTLWVAAFPKTLQLLKSAVSPPRTVETASAVFSIKKVGEGKGNGGSKCGYLVEKILEDGVGEILSGETIAVHDVASGRIFVGGIMAGFLGVCEKRK